jgi:hypothetical protein
MEGLAECKMMYERNYYKWKRAKGNHAKPKQRCPRCNNEVNFELLYDGPGLAFGTLQFFTYPNVHAYKCPICPYFEPISKELAPAIIKGK